MGQVGEKTESSVLTLDIEGVLFQPLNYIQSPAGDVLHGIREDYKLAPDFNKGFGELYFSEILTGHVKGWKYHKKQTQHFMVPYGQIKIVLYDDRKDSISKGRIITCKLGRPESYGLLKIPSQIWYSFAALNDKAALICNYADIPHDPEESITLPLKNDVIPYKWHIES